jgi:hypothetical protein
MAMPFPLRSLVTDLEIRADVALGALEGAPELSGRTKDARERIQHFKNAACKLLEEDIDQARDQVYPAYADLTQSLYETQTFELPFLLHHDRAAERATRLCTALLKNIKWPYDQLLVSTFSTEYYSTFAAWRVIAAPIGEERRLLGIPDLCHELGHTVFANHAKVLAGNMLNDLAAHLQSYKGIEHKFMTDVDDVDDVYYSWQRSWLQEFICDLIATYMVGPAFPRQHVRLRAMRQPPWTVYQCDLDKDHPADNARMEACLHLIDDAGFGSEADELRGMWKEMIIDERRPIEYEVFYPSQLLLQLVRLVVEGCKKRGLRPYDPEADPDFDIPRLTNVAWDHFEREPDSYRQWEEESVARLWAEWGLSD